MSRLLILIAALTLIGATPAGAAKPAQTAVLATTGPLACDGVEHTFYWVAPTNLTLWTVETFPLSDGAPTGEPFPMVDWHVSARVSNPPGRIIAVQALDHYVPFTGDASKATVFTKETAAHMKKGEHVSVAHSCQALFGLLSHSQVIVILTFVPE